MAIRQLRLRDLSRSQLQNLAIALEAELKPLRSQLVEARNAHDVLFKLIVGYLKREPAGSWQARMRTRLAGTRLDTLQVPKSVFEDDVKGWRLKFDPQGDTIVVSIVYDPPPPPSVD
jgi:hypothetical protein